MPQWNCSCPNCEAARLGRISSRTQSSVALSSDGQSWYLVNASPDLPAQILAFPPLRPQPAPLRNTPIAGLLITNSDLDHLLGLFLLREGRTLDVIATEAVRDTAELSLGLETVLNSFCGSRWRQPAFENFAALDPNKPDGIHYHAINLPGKPPRFAASGQFEADLGQSVAYVFLDPRTGGRLLVAPDVSAITPRLSEALSVCDVILFDGTFWSSDELRQVRPDASKAADMGHLTIENGSLKLLAGAPARNKVYIHINNTNPILAEKSLERTLVESAGITVGADGMEFEL